jgi:hypothetical protein
MSAKIINALDNQKNEIVIFQLIFRGRINGELPCASVL